MLLFCCVSFTYVVTLFFSCPPVQYDNRRNQLDFMLQALLRSYRICAYNQYITKESNFWCNTYTIHNKYTKYTYNLYICYLYFITKCICWIIYWFMLQKLRGSYLVKFNNKISVDWQEYWLRLNRELNFVLIPILLKATVMLILKCPSVKRDFRL